jgi:hypothetical protein
MTDTKLDRNYADLELFKNISTYLGTSASTGSEFV